MVLEVEINNVFQLIQAEQGTRRRLQLQKGQSNPPAITPTAVSRSVDAETTPKNSQEIQVVQEILGKPQTSVVAPVIALNITNKIIPIFRVMPPATPVLTPEPEIIPQDFVEVVLVHSPEDPEPKEVRSPRPKKKNRRSKLSPRKVVQHNSAVSSPVMTSKKPAEVSSSPKAPSTDTSTLFASVLFTKTSTASPNKSEISSPPKTSSVPLTDTSAKFGVDVPVHTRYVPFTKRSTPPSKKLPEVPGSPKTPSTNTFTVSATCLPFTETFTAPSNKPAEISSPLPTSTVPVTEVSSNSGVDFPMHARYVPFTKTSLAPTNKLPEVSGPLKTPPVDTSSVYSSCLPFTKTFTTPSNEPAEVACPLPTSTVPVTETSSNSDVDVPIHARYVPFTKTSTAPSNKLPEVSGSPKPPTGLSTQTSSKLEVDVPVYTPCPYVPFTSLALEAAASPCSTPPPMCPPTPRDDRSLRESLMTPVNPPKTPQRVVTTTQISRPVYSPISSPESVHNSPGPSELSSDVLSFVIDSAPPVPALDPVDIINFLERSPTKSASYQQTPSSQDFPDISELLRLLQKSPSKDIRAMKLLSPYQKSYVHPPPSGFPFRPPKQQPVARNLSEELSRLDVPTQVVANSNVAEAERRPRPSWSSLAVKQAAASKNVLPSFETFKKPASVVKEKKKPGHKKSKSENYMACRLPDGSFQLSKLPSEVCSRKRKKSKNTHSGDVKKRKVDTSMVMTLPNPDGGSRAMEACLLSEKQFQELSQTGNVEKWSFPTE